MRSLLVLPVALALVAGCGKDRPGPQKLRKMAYKVHVDETGRMLPTLELFDEKHRPMIVVGAYTLTISRPDGSVLCSLSRPLAKEDFTDKAGFKGSWQDAACPPDPGAEQLRIALEVKTGDQPDAPKLAREVTTPTRFVYRHLAPPAPAGSGSGSAGSAGSAAPPVDRTKLPAEAPLPEPAPATGSATGAAARTGSASDAPSGSAAPSPAK